MRLVGRLHGYIMNPFKILTLEDEIGNDKAEFQQCDDVAA